VTLFSTKDDFLRTTLDKVPGMLGKLSYVSELRESDGRYFHWGLIRIYGEEAAQRALAEVHRALFLQVLRTPVNQLVDDTIHSGAAERGKARAFLKALSRQAQSLIPPDLAGGSVAHFNSVVVALLALLE